MRRLDASAAVPVYVTIFLEPGLGLRSNVIGANHPAIERGMRVQRHQHGRWLRTVDRYLKTYANEYCPFLSCCWPEITQPIAFGGSCLQTDVKGFEG